MLAAINLAEAPFELKLSAVMFAERLKNLV